LIIPDPAAEGQKKKLIRLASVRVWIYRMHTNSTWTREARLENLWRIYRSAFRDWVSAQHLLQPQGGLDLPAARRAAAAASAYRQARDHLTAEMMVPPK
jgi:hypothetical protein